MSDPRNVWQNLNTKGTAMSANDVRAKAQKMADEIRRDTTIAFVIAGAMTLAGGAALYQEHETAARVITGLAILMVWLGVWRTAVRRRSQVSEADPTVCLQFYRHELQRRRDYFAKPPWILVFAVILALLQFVAVARRLNAATADLWRYPIALVVLALIALPFWKREARKFQRELNELNKFEADRSEPNL